VFEAALELIDSGPPESFSMRRLAETLGLTAMALYSYAADKDALIEGATLTALAAAGGHEPVSDTHWREQLAVPIREIHRVMKEHPHLATLVIGNHARSKGLFRIRERMLGTLVDNGFDETAALHALGVLIYYALGFTGGQAALADVPPEDVLPPLPPGEFPHLTAARRNFSRHASDEAFEFGLKLLLDGLQPPSA
jgi:AcrR family transcriptional regulator